VRKSSRKWRSGSRPMVKELLEALRREEREI